MFFDFKTCKMWHKIKASDSAVSFVHARHAMPCGVYPLNLTHELTSHQVLGVAWHPRESSKVVTGDLDGVIKYWD